MASLGTIDGGSNARQARSVGTLRSSPSRRSFGDVFASAERTEWFRFQTVGSRFSRSSLIFAAAADQVKVRVFFNANSGNGGIGRQIGQLTLTGTAKNFISRTRGAGTYFIQATRQGSGSIAYGIAFEISGSSSQRLSASQASTGRELFF